MPTKTKKIDPSNPLEQVSFICRPCEKSFSSAPARVEDDPEGGTHPFAYFCKCPNCGQDCKQQPWEIGLMRSYGHHTGPKTEEGKAKAHKNLDGYPTAEQRKRIRFNGLKHGMYAQTLEFFPARPGQYLQCDGCPIDHDVCRSNTICAKEADRAMRYQMAFADNDPNQLRDLQANTQARIQSIFDNILLSIIKTGVQIESPVWHVDPEKGLQLVEYIDANGEKQSLTEIKAHPLLKNLSEFIARNNQSMADMGMTNKLRDIDQELNGNLSAADNKGDELLDYQRRQTDALEGLKTMIANSKERVQRDPILIEHGGDNG